MGEAPWAGAGAGAGTRGAGSSTSPTGDVAMRTGMRTASATLPREDEVGVRLAKRNRHDADATWSGTG